MRLRLRLFSEYKQRRESSSGNPSPEKRQTNGSFWEQDAASGQKDEEDLEFDAFMSDRS
eukprot:COSAG02_NODE_3782_length_6235_cov_21.044817_4_plen_59_part_00